MATVGVALLVGLPLHVYSQVPGIEPRGGVYLWPNSTEEGNWNEFKQATVQGAPYTLRGIRACVEGDVPEAVIERVELVDARGIRLTGVAVRDVEIEPQGVANEKGTLTQWGWPANRTVRTPCWRDGRHGQSYVPVELVRTDPTWGGTRGFRIHWRAGRRTGTWVTYAFVLCSEQAADRDGADDGPECPSLMPR